MKQQTIMQAVVILAIAIVVAAYIMQPEPTAEELQAEAQLETARAQAEDK